MGHEAERVEKGKIHLGEALRDPTWNATGEQVTATWGSSQARLTLAAE